MHFILAFLWALWPILGLSHVFPDTVPQQKDTHLEDKDFESSRFAAIEASVIADKKMPRFVVDTSWPQIPAGYLIGQVSGVAVDRDGDIWVVQRPRSLHSMDIGATREPPISMCCKPLKEVIEFDSDGVIKRNWSGAASAPVIEGVRQYPSNIHGIFVDSDQSVWVGGNGKGDHIVAKFSANGQYLAQFGLRNKTQGNLDQRYLGNPADIYFDPSDKRVLIADGYTNRRVIEFNYPSRQFTQYWGAFADLPEDASRQQTFDFTQAMTTPDGGVDPRMAHFSDIVHCVVRGPDNFYYACDRRNNRIQVFSRKNSGQIEFVESIVIAPMTGGTGSATDIAWSPDGAFMYVADMINGRIWVFDAKTKEKLGSIGRPGRYAGQFHWLHSLDADQEGNLYATEVHTGQRVQKLVFVGIQ